MSTKEKLVIRFIQQPKDFTWEELVRLFGTFGFTTNNKGKKSGSRIVFKNGNDFHSLHKPHPSNIIKSYAMKQILDFFVEKEYIK